MSFPCTKCGACCRRVGSSPYSEHLAGRDGRCRHLNADNTCSIYEQRPDVCRVDLMLERFGIPKHFGYEANAALCNRWMREDGMKTFVSLTINETGRP